MVHESYETCLEIVGATKSSRSQPKKQKSIKSQKYMIWMSFKLMDPGKKKIPKLDVMLWISCCCQDVIQIAIVSSPFVLDSYIQVTSDIKMEHPLLMEKMFSVFT